MSQLWRVEKVTQLTLYCIFPHHYLTNSRYSFIMQLLWRNALTLILMQRFQHVFKEKKKKEEERNDSSKYAVHF